MTSKATLIANKKGFKNTSFINCDIDDLKIESETVDVVISNCVINLLPDKLKVYKEIFRILKPGGRISISDIVTVNTLPSWVPNDPKYVATWVGCSISTEYLKVILETAGFLDYLVVEEDLTKEYLNKWGHDLDLKQYIKKGKIIAIKPE